MFGHWILFLYPKFVFSLFFETESKIKFFFVFNPFFLFGHCFQSIFCKMFSLITNSDFPSYIEEISPKWKKEATPRNPLATHHNDPSHKPTATHPNPLQIKLPTETHKTPPRNPH